jgi:predicted nucleic-acid-binding Zn-ribbon protein
MYLAQLSTFQTQAPFYINVLENIIKGNNINESKVNIDFAISEAAEVAKGNKSIFKIDNNHYFLVTTLLSKYNEKLLKIEDRNIQAQTYSDILNILL